MLYKVGTNRILTTNSKLANKIKRIEDCLDPVEDKVRNSEEELYVEVRGIVGLHWNRWDKINELCARRKSEILWYYVEKENKVDRVWYNESYNKLSAKLRDYMQLTNWKTSDHISVELAIYLPLKGFTKKKAKEVFEDRIELAKAWLDDRTSEVLSRGSSGY